MKARRYFVSALPVEGTGLFAREIEAAHFQEAEEKVIDLAGDYFGPERDFRITGVTEQPDLGESIARLKIDALEVVLR